MPRVRTGHRIRASGISGSAFQELDPPLRDFPDLYLLDAGPGQEHVALGVLIRFAHVQQKTAWLPVADQTRYLPAAPGGDRDEHALLEGVGDLRGPGKPLLRFHVRLPLAALIDHLALYLPQVAQARTTDVNDAYRSYRGDPDQDPPLRGPGHRPSADPSASSRRASGRRGGRRPSWWRPFRGWCVGSGRSATGMARRCPRRCRAPRPERPIASPHRPDLPRTCR